MKPFHKIASWSREFGYRQVPVWYESSAATIDEFDTIGKNLKILKVIPNPFPFYDWIMGFYERPSNREALKGPMLQRSREIVDVGVGTGYLLSQLVEATGESQRITAVDLSRQMLHNAQGYLEKQHQLSPRVTFEQADCTAMPWPENTFDLYVSSYLFDLLPEAELRAAIREVQRVLKPDGYAILITMTTELQGVSRFAKFFYRVMNELYILGYRKGRWNAIWKPLFAGYAPHCRPIALGRYLEESTRLIPTYTKVSRVSLFPVRVYYVRKGHD